MRFFLLLSMLVFIGLGCASSNPEQVDDDKGETLQGIAWDAKAGAVLKTPDNHLYYIDSLRYWDDEFLGKWVEVTGESRKAYFIGPPELLDEGARTQKSTFKVRAIMNASWRLMPNSPSKEEN